MWRRSALCRCQHHDEYTWHIKDGTITGGKGPGVNAKPIIPSTDRRVKFRFGSHNTMQFWALYDKICFESENVAGDCRQRTCHATDMANSRDGLIYYHYRREKIPPATLNTPDSPGCLKSVWPSLSGGIGNLASQWTTRVAHDTSRVFGTEIPWVRVGLCSIVW